MKMTGFKQNCPFQKTGQILFYLQFIATKEHDNKKYTVCRPDIVEVVISDKAYIGPCGFLSVQSFPIQKFDFYIKQLFYRYISQ